jgi:hypothetical protein
MAKLKSFKVEYGSSVEIKGTWHKFNCGVELEIEDGDDTDAVKKRAWNTVYNEIEKQVSELLNA